MVEALVLGLMALVGLAVLILVLIVSLSGNQVQTKRQLASLERQVQAGERRLAELVLSLQGLDLDLLAIEKGHATWWQRIQALEDQLQEVDQRLAELILCLQVLDLDLPRLGSQPLTCLDPEHQDSDRRDWQQPDAERVDLDGVDVERVDSDSPDGIGLDLDRLQSESLEADRLYSDRLESDELRPERSDRGDLALQGRALDSRALDSRALDSPALDNSALDGIQQPPSRPLPKSSRLRAAEADPPLAPQELPGPEAPAMSGPAQAPASPSPLAPRAPEPTGPAGPPPAAGAMPPRQQPAAARPPVRTSPSAPVAPGKPRAAVAVRSPRSQPAPTALRLFWRRIERLVVANWTGILGVVMVVAGVSFVAINMALTMGPQARFWLTVGAAAVLVVPSLLWGRRTSWQNLTAWMRSGGAALFLFACSAAGGVPDLGLTWQRDPGGALALLLLGGMANLLVAVLARSQTIAALHGVLTLVPLMIAAPSGLTLGLATLVAVLSLVLPLKHAWHGQRLVACLAYGCFQLTWLGHGGEDLALASPGGPSLRWLAAGAAITVFGCGVLLAHRGLDLAIPTQMQAPGQAPGQAPSGAIGENLNAAGATPGGATAAIPLQLLGLLSNWTSLGLALLLYPQSPGLRFGGLVLGWAGATLLARRTPRSSQPWLRRADRLVAQALAIAALLSLLGPIANGPLLIFALLLEAVLFVRLGQDASDAWIGLVGWGLVNLAGFGLLLAVVNQGAVPGQGALAAATTPLALAQQNRVLLLAASALTIALQGFLHRKRPGTPDASDRPWPGSASPDSARPAPGLGEPTVSDMALEASPQPLQSQLQAQRQAQWQAQSVPALPIPSLLGWLAAALAFGAAWTCAPAGWQELVALGSLGPLLLLGRARPLPGLVSGASTAIVVSHGASWISWAGLARQGTLAAQASQVLPHLIPLLMLGMVMATSTSGSRRRGAILLIGFTAALGAFQLAAPLPPLALAAAWLGLGLVALGIAPRLPRQEACHVLVLGLLDLVGASAIAIAQHPEGNPGAVTAVLLGASALTVAYQQQMDRLALNGPQLPLLGWLAAGLAFTAAWWGAPQGWQEPVALLGLGSLLLFSRRQPLPGVVNASATAIAIGHGVSWLTLLAGHPWPAATLWCRLLALVTLGLVMACCTNGQLALLAIDLIGMSSGLGTYLLVAPLSPLAPAGAWLGLSLLALGAADRLGKEKASHALAIGLIALLMAGCLGLSQGGPGPELVTVGRLAIRARLLVDLAGLAVVLTWWRWPASPQLAGNGLWIAIRPRLVEAFLLGVLITLGLEVPGPWQPLAWSLLALALLSPAMERLLAPRIKLYSVGLQWVAIAAGVATATPFAGPPQGGVGPLGLGQAGMAPAGAIGLAAIAIQVLYVLASHRWLVLAGPEARAPSQGLARFALVLGRHRNQLLYYPLVLGIALDLASRYDHALLTLLWAAEAFVLFGLSALLRENQFRYLALAGLGGCLLRLVAVDMRQADMGLRGLVFIGVGLLMLAMNALYNRFRSRFEAD